jgi:lipoprotein-anchoring transpeptidase ErfK/SrfK
MPLSSPPPALAPPTPPAVAAGDDLGRRIAAINAAGLDSGPGAGPASVALLIRVQALLARARFSPGAVDGRPGSNLAHVLTAYQISHGLKADGALDAATWSRLLHEPTAARPVARSYTITSQDVAGPFAPDVGEDLAKLAALPEGPQFSTPLETLAARFHMSRDRLAALNPGVDFRKAGARILVVDAAPAPFRKGDVASIRISKSKALAAVFDRAGVLLAVYPATVGSRERPSPSGVHKVASVSEPASYVYDPQRLAWGPRAGGKLLIKPGPKGPIGTVWIALDAPTYGIHGSPNAEMIGKTASHGCVRLTNWDAEGLAAGVRPGVTVAFQGQRASG